MQQKQIVVLESGILDVLKGRYGMVWSCFLIKIFLK